MERFYYVNDINKQNWMQYVCEYQNWFYENCHTIYKMIFRQLYLFICMLFLSHFKRTLYLKKIYSILL